VTPYYHSDAALEHYFLFHYGAPEEVCPLLPEARFVANFPVRCVTESLARIKLEGRTRALDLGCAVGRSSFELTRTFDEVIGIDYSARFIEAAREMQAKRSRRLRVLREGSLMDEVEVKLPDDLPAGRVKFETGDACGLRDDLGSFDFVLMANLLDRLGDPAKCLARLPALARPGGWLVLTSPYTWLEEHTSRAKWPKGGTLEMLQKALAPGFELHANFDLPFLIREHRRKYQLSVAEASIWRRV
jgi:putative 4-mercaptohistidine N1-methyltranferase